MLECFLHQFGSVVEVIRPVDKMKEDAPKNFCFVTFDKEEPAKQLVMKGFTSIKGHQVVISRVSFELICNFSSLFPKVLSVLL